MKRLALLTLLLSAPAHAADLAPQSLGLNGIAPTYNTASAGGDTFTNDGRAYVHLKNGSGGSISVTLDAVATVRDNALGDIAIPDTVIAVPAGAERIVGLLPPGRFNSSTGKVSLTYSGVTSLGVAVVRVGKVYQLTYDAARPRYTLPLGGKDYELVGTFELIENVEHAMQEGIIQVAVRTMAMGVADTARLIAAILATQGEKTDRREVGQMLYAMGADSEAYARLKVHLFAFLHIMLAPQDQREAKAKEMGELTGKLARPASCGKTTRGSA